MRRRCRRRRARLRMGWLRSLLSPLRRLWCRVNAVQQRKSTSSRRLIIPLRFLRFFPPMSLNNASVGGAERGIYILYDDVKSCPCEDVHVLWSILVESHGLPPPTPPVLRLTKR
jgi:hypothetical protein